MFYCCRTVSHSSVRADDPVVCRRTDNIFSAPYIYLLAYGEGPYDWAQIGGVWRPSITHVVDEAKRSLPFVSIHHENDRHRAFGTLPLSHARWQMAP